jgi:DedD protein
VERHVKERLIGAAVLVAAAVILIPEMLSGRGDASGDKPVAATPAAGETPLKTYTIDLNRSATQSATPAPESLTTSAPPPETAPPPESVAEAASAPHTQAIPESEPSNAAPQRESPPPIAATTAPAERPAVAKAVAPAPARSAIADNKPAAAGWAVQLGSFSSRATADGMAGKLRGEGYDTFVMPVKSGASTLYRVRIGPMADREGAVRVLGKVKARVPAATVVKHP